MTAYHKLRLKSFTKWISDKKIGIIKAEKFYEMSTRYQYRISNFDKSTLKKGPK